MFPVFLWHPVVTFVNSAVLVVITCSAFVGHSIKIHSRNLAVLWGWGYAHGIKGLANAASSAESLDSGIDAHVISPTLRGF